MSGINLKAEVEKIFCDKERKQQIITLCEKVREEALREAAEEFDGLDVPYLVLGEIREKILALKTAYTSSDEGEKR